MGSSECPSGCPGERPSECPSVGLNVGPTEARRGTMDEISALVADAKEQLTSQMPGGIYKIRNTVNGNQYVGSAVNLVQRKSMHWTRLRREVHENGHLQRAWKKYGEENFEFLVVGRCLPDRLLALEQEVMDHLKPEYNINPTAGSSLGVQRSEKTLHKISKAKMGRVHTEETRRNMSEAKMGNTNALGHVHTEEHRRKIGDAQIGHVHTEEARHKISEALMGHVVTEETRRKISKAKMGNTYVLGRVHTKEARRKMSESQRRRWAKEKIV